MSLKVVYPPIVDGVIVVKKAPLIVICAYEEAPELGAFLFRMLTQPTVIWSIPWPGTQTQQAFVFPTLNSGKHQLVLFDSTPPQLTLATYTVRVQGRSVLKKARTADPPTILSPLQDGSSLRTVYSHGTSGDGNPAGVTARVECKNSDLFPAANPASPDFTSDDTWYIRIDVDEPDPHQKFKFTATNSSNQSSEVTGITITSVKTRSGRANKAKAGGGTRKRGKSKATSGKQA